MGNSGTCGGRVRLLLRNGLVSDDSGRHRRLRIFGDLRARTKIHPILDSQSLEHI
jgi:hypothetical protein